MGELSDGVVVRIPGFHCRGLGSIPGQGTEMPQAERGGQKKKKKEVWGGPEILHFQQVDDVLSPKQTL